MSRIALVQMTGGIDPAANAATLVEAVERAGAEGAAMLFTPEMSNLIDRDRDRAVASIVGESEDVVLAAVREAAARAGLWVHLGSIAVRRDDGRLANRALVIDAAGAIRARYDKIHLFDVNLPNGEAWRESASYAPGERAVAVDTPVGRLGLSICYDLRFPDLYRALSDAGATLFAVPTAFTRPTGAAHWEILLRARAIEAGVHVIAAAQVGDHADGRATWGHSLVVDPCGAVLRDMGDDAGLAFVDLDPDAARAARSRIPAIDHRRAIPPVEIAR